MHHRWISRSIIALSLASTVGCKSEGSFSGDLAETETPSGTPTSAGESATPGKVAPPPKHENVPFSWQSTDGGQSGSIQTTLPDGETFSGHFHQITSTTTVATLGDFHGGWYAGPWDDPAWGWDDDWGYYDDPEEYIKNYSGRVVAMLTSEQGDSMRCHFRLDSPERGMKGGGQGDCQLSNGERITAVFPAA